MQILVDFGLKYGLTTASQGATLAPLFEKAADEVGMTPLALAKEAMDNQELGEYLADVARKVATQAVQEGIL